MKGGFSRKPLFESYVEIITKISFTFINFSKKIEILKIAAFVKWFYLLFEKAKKESREG